MGWYRNCMDLTLLTCNYNTSDLTINMLKSLKMTSSKLPKVVVINTSDSEDSNLLQENGIPYFNYRGASHGEAVNLGLKKVNTRYVLLVDTDIIFLKDFVPAFNRFESENFTLMGKVVGDVAGKNLHPRIEPWYCFIDLEKLKMNKIQFFDRDRTKNSKHSDRIYDIGSSMFEDIVLNNGTVANVDLEDRYFKHYGGMSWRTQKFNPNDGDTDIDFGGTHPHRVLYDIGIQIRAEYYQETNYLKPVDIKGVYSY